MIPRIQAMGLLVVSALLFATPASSEDSAETWRGLGSVYGPYTDTCFASTQEADIEHIEATSEAHDSGLCARDRATRARFASDLRNLTLAPPRLNRHRKSGKGSVAEKGEKPLLGH